MNPAEEYILNQPEPAKSILLHLQILIEATLPDAVMLFKYKIPFYYIDAKQPFCFLGHSKGYVDVGFWHGAHLTLHSEMLVSKGRKHMKSLRYYKPEDVNADILIDVLAEAYSVRHKKYYK